MSCTKHRRFDLPKHQKMATVSPYRFDLNGPAFSRTCQIDYKGPYTAFEVKNFVSQRTTRGSNATRNLWYAGIICLSTGAFNLEVVDDYSVDGLILVLGKHVARHGAPSRIVMDRGSQMTCLAGAKEKFDIDNNEIIADHVVEWDLVQQAFPQVELVVVPTASHYCAQVERVFLEVEKSLKKRLSGRPLGYSQWTCLGHNIANCINGRPLYMSGLTEAGDGELEVITPNDLLIGRPNNRDIFSKGVLGNLSPTYQLVLKLREQWWKDWVNIAPSCLYKRSKWKREIRSFRPGDIVYYAADQQPGSYQLCRVTKIISEDDNAPVHSVEVEYVSGKHLKRKSRKVSTACLVLLAPCGYNLNQIGDQAPDDFGWEEMTAVQQNQEQVEQPGVEGK